MHKRLHASNTFVLYTPLQLIGRFSIIPAYNSEHEKSDPANAGKVYP